MRKISFFIILILFVIFSIFITKFEDKFEVLEVYNPSQIGVDFNKNGQIDNEEVLNLKLNLKKFGKDEEQFAYDYFAKEYSINLLKNKKVKYNSNKNDIEINGQSYVDTFNNHEIILKNLDNLRILNLKSKKYHRLSCKYGRMAHDYIIVKKSDLPKDAKECKVCKITKPEKAKPTEIDNTMATLDTGSVKVAFTDLTKTLKPDDSCGTDICKLLKYNIDKSKYSIDMAIYGYNNIPKIKQALINAQNRGVKIRMIYDIDSNNKNYYPDTLPLSNIIKDTNCDKANQSTKPFIMHNKFIIFDDKTVFTGSANISPSDLSNYNSNSFIIIKSEKVAQVYKNEFNQMLSGKFHNEKTKTPKNKFVIGATELSVYFSPQDKTITNQIIPLVNNSKHSIYMPTFLITHKGLTNALISAKNRGVKIKIIVDAGNANNKYSQHKLLRSAGIDVKVENYAGKMHSKTIIIDRETVIIGSMNFSKSGELKNDENTIILKNPQIADFFINQFNIIWNKIPDKYLKLNISAESKDSIGSCFDGVDNNFDGKIDKQDEGCKYLKH